MGGSLSGGPIWRSNKKIFSIFFYLDFRIPGFWEFFSGCWDFYGGFLWFFWFFFIIFILCQRFFFDLSAPRGGGKDSNEFQSHYWILFQVFITEAYYKQNNKSTNYLPYILSGRMTRKKTRHNRSLSFLKVSSNVLCQNTKLASVYLFFLDICLHSLSYYYNISK